MKLQSPSKLRHLNSILGQQIIENSEEEDTLSNKNTQDHTIHLNKNASQKSYFSERAMEDKELLLKMEKENKLNKDKIAQMKSRINNMKIQQESYNKQLSNFKAKEKKEHEIQKYKQEMKNKLEQLKAKETHKNEVRKRQAQYIKIRFNDNIKTVKESKEARAQSLIIKTRNDRNIMNEMKIQSKEYIYNTNVFKHCKIEHDIMFSKTRNLKDKAQRTQSMRNQIHNKILSSTEENIMIKNQLENLEKIEENCFALYKKTIQNHKRLRNRRLNLGNTISNFNEYFNTETINTTSIPSFNKNGSLSGRLSRNKNRKVIKSQDCSRNCGYYQ